MKPVRQSRTLQPFIESLNIGDEIGHLNLTLVPLGGEGRGHLEYILAADAIAAGQLTVTEITEGGSVPELLASNGSDRLMLLLDGERGHSPEPRLMARSITPR